MTERSDEIADGKLEKSRIIFQPGFYRKPVCTAVSRRFPKIDIPSSINTEHLKLGRRTRLQCGLVSVEKSVDGFRGINAIGVGFKRQYEIACLRLGNTRFEFI